MDGRLITDRFADGDPSNNELRYGGFDVRDMTFRHGGDFRGLRLGAAQGGGGKRRMVEIRRKIEVEEVCRNGYNSYHQYSQLDFTLLDQRLGTKEELRRLTEQAHALGLYVSWMVKSGRRRRNAVISVVINEQLNMNRDCRRGDEPHELLGTEIRNEFFFEGTALRVGGAAASVWSGTAKWAVGVCFLHFFSCMAAQRPYFQVAGHKEGRAPWRMHETVQGREYLLLTRKPMEELHSTPAGRQPYMDFWYNNTWDPQAQYPGTLYGQHGEATVDVGHGTYESSDFHHNGDLQDRTNSDRWTGPNRKGRSARRRFVVAAWELRRRSKKETEEIGFGVRQAMDVETRLRLLEAEVLQPSNQHRREGTQKLQEAVDLLEEFLGRGKLYGTMDDLRLEHRRVQQKYLAMSNALISSCDVDGFRVDTPMQVPLVFYKAWVPAVKLRWQEDVEPMVPWAAGLRVAVPNVAGVVQWFVKNLSISMWRNECRWDLACRSQSFPSLLATPPLQFLPKLSDVVEFSQEPTQRLHFWGSILLWSPFLMAFLCEAMRLIVGSLKPKTSIDSTLRYGRLQDLETNDPDAETPRHTPSKVQANGFGQSICFTLALVLYHIVCAGIVAMAILYGWLSPDGGGLSWELWALWQQLCLWTLFLQNVVRCATLDREALAAPTTKTVLLYTVPFLSELADTMKDWVVTGICFLHAGAVPVRLLRSGFAVGAAVVLLELCGTMLGVIPPFIQISKGVKGLSISPPLILLQVVCATCGLQWAVASCNSGRFSYCRDSRFAGYLGLLLFLTFLAWILARCTGTSGHQPEEELEEDWRDSPRGRPPSDDVEWAPAAESSPWRRPRVGTLFIPKDGQADGCSAAPRRPLLLLALAMLGTLGSWPRVGSVYLGYVEGVFHWMTDGGLLTVLSTYVIFYSYVRVCLNDDCAQDLRKTYGGILELPAKPAAPLATETRCDWMARQLGNLCVDFLSSSRLLIAWAEDWPQGFIGVVLVFAIHSHATESQQPKKIGFAGISAIISVGKGILIPFFQKYMFEQRSAAVQRGLDALLSPLTLEVLVDQLPGPVQARKVGRTLQELVREDSRDVLKRLNVGESELFHPIHQLRSDWLNDLLNPENRFFRAFQRCLLRSYGAEAVRELGFSVAECQRAGFTLGQCRIAGYPPDECRDVYETGDEKTGRQLKAVGFSAMDCKNAGLSAVVCRAEGFSAKDCKDAGYSPRDCKISAWKDLLGTPLCHARRETAMKRPAALAMKRPAASAMKRPAALKRPSSTSAAVLKLSVQDSRGGGYPLVNMSMEIEKGQRIDDVRGIIAQAFGGPPEFMQFSSDGQNLSGEDSIDTLAKRGQVNLDLRQAPDAPLPGSQWMGENTMQVPADAEERKGTVWMESTGTGALSATEVSADDYAALLRTLQEDEDLMRLRNSPDNFRTEVNDVVAERDCTIAPDPEQSIEYFDAFATAIHAAHASVNSAKGDAWLRVLGVVKYDNISFGILQEYDGEGELKTRFLVEVLMGFSDALYRQSHSMWMGARYKFFSHRFQVWRSPTQGALGPKASSFHASLQEAFEMMGYAQVGTIVVQQLERVRAGFAENSPTKLFQDARDAAQASSTRVVFPPMRGASTKGAGPSGHQNVGIGAVVGCLKEVADGSPMRKASARRASAPVDASIFGEFYVTPERYSTMTGRGKDHAMYHRRVGSQAFEGCGGD
ncbi:unnamed protein product [Durusdinium trenchii]|uniref:Glycosyl hydrolase family 13 catalytic domain-containing protein n=1 Tax=Durusdinium trenchii TaxID=1381693 RepID=A0ABP0NDN3_9DINO